jgi:hypothetical protein
VFRINTFSYLCSFYILYYITKLYSCKDKQNLIKKQTSIDVLGNRGIRWSEDSRALRLMSKLIHLRVRNANPARFHELGFEAIILLSRKEKQTID